MGEQAAREARQRRKQRPTLDVSKLRVHDGVPLPPKQVKRQLRQQLFGLLASLEINQSIEVPASARGTLFKAVTDANKMEGRCYEARQLPGGVLVGVWRTK
jgi:hypothetical protein